MREHLEAFQVGLFAHAGQVEVLVVMADVDDRLLASRLARLPLSERRFRVVGNLPAVVFENPIE